MKLLIYMDNAATSFPKPPSVLSDMMDCMTKYGANPGRSSHSMAIKAGELVYNARENAAQFLGVNDAERLIFCFSATDALNMGIMGYLDKGDHVITSSMEHNSVLRPLNHLESIGIECEVIYANDYGFIDPAAIQEKIKSNTKLIVITHASNVVGTIQPVIKIGDIAKSYGVAFMVDAAQSAGILPINFDDMPIDMLAFSGHKSLLGVQGTGGLLLSKECNIKPLRYGGTGSYSKSIVQPEDLPDKYESGTLNTPGICGLNAGVNHIENTGREVIREHEKALSEHLLKGIKKNKEIGRAHV